MTAPPVETTLVPPRPVRPRGTIRSVAGAVAWRSLKTFYSRPALFLPSLVFPLFFYTAFAGGLAGIANVPGFDYPPGYTTFQWAFVFLQGSMFGGVFLGFALIRDFDTGFMRRILLAAPDRRGIVLGYSVAAAVRAGVFMVVITVVGFATGVNFEGTVLDFALLVLLAFALNQVGALWSVGTAMRIRNVQGGPLIQMPVFVIFFLAPVFVPMALLEGWIRGAARINPISRVITASRDLVAGDTDTAGIAFLVVVGLIVALTVWAIRSLRSAERAGA